MLLHLCFCQTNIVAQALSKEFGSLCGILHQEVRHDDVGNHFVEMTCAEVEHLLTVCLLDGCSAGIELLCHSLHTSLQTLKLRCNGEFFVVLDDLSIETVGSE